MKTITEKQARLTVHKKLHNNINSMNMDEEGMYGVNKTTETDYKPVIGKGSDYYHCTVKSTFFLLSLRSRGDI